MGTFLAQGVFVNEEEGLLIQWVHCHPGQTPFDVDHIWLCGKWINQAGASQPDCWHRWVESNLPRVTDHDFINDLCARLKEETDKQDPKEVPTT